MKLTIEILYILLVFVVCTFADEQEDADLACSRSTKPVVLTASEGYFESQNYPDEYEEGSRCTWLIEPSVDIGEDQALFLEFVDLRLDSGDTLTIFKGDNSIYPEDILYVIDSVIYPGTIYTLNEHVINVVFMSDFYHGDQAFRIRYYIADKGPVQDVSELACTSSTRPAVLTNATGFIESLDFPSDYPVRQCEWLIQPSTSEGIYLSVMYYYTFDHLYIYDNDSPTGDYVYWYYTESPGTTVLTTSGSAYLSFHPFYHEEYSGFQLYYFPEDAACAGGAASILTATSTPEELISPGYPYVVPDHISCRWLIRAEDENQKVLLTVLEFDLHESRNCEDEYLEIYDGDSADAFLLGRYCGDDAIGIVPSTQDALQLYLRTRTSSVSEGKNGFSMTYSSSV